MSSLISVNTTLMQIEKKLERIAAALESIAADKVTFKGAYQPPDAENITCPQQCKCPKFTGPHIRELGCLDVWIT